MIPAGLALVGALVTALGLLLGGTDAATLRRGAAPMLLLMVTLGTWVSAEPYGLGKADVVAIARGADGLPATSTVTFEGTAGSRTVRQVTLERPVPLAAPLLGGLALLCLGGLVLGSRAAAARPTPPPEGSERLLGGLAIALAVGAAYVLWGGGPASGPPSEADVRVTLAAAGVGPQSGGLAFSVPLEPLTFVSGRPWALLGGAALVAGMLLFRGSKLAGSGRLVFVGAALAAVAPAASIVLMGGFAWRPATGLLWAAALLTAGAAFETTSRHRAAVLAGGALGLALLQF